MNIKDVIQLSLTVSVVVLLMLVLVSLVAYLASRGKGRTWKERHPGLLRYLLIRVGIAVAAGASALVLVSAALVLNSHRPPADNTPGIKVAAGSGPVNVTLSMDDCNGPIQGSLSITGQLTSRRATFYSDQDGVRTIPLNRDGNGRFELSNPTSKRGLLSCYIQLPVVKGSSGNTRVQLKLNEQMEVDTMASAPSPDAYLNGRWIWNCEKGETCPALATAGYAVEEGTKQVIVLVLAALFGSMIALFIGEALIEPIRSTLRRPGNRG